MFTIYKGWRSPQGVGAPTLRNPGSPLETSLVLCYREETTSYQSSTICPQNSYER